MARLGLVAFLIAVALVIGYLAGDGRDHAPPRAPTQTRAVQQLEARVLELERRMGIVAQRLKADPGAPADVERAEEESTTPADEVARETATPEETARAREKHKQEWLERYRNATTGPARLAVLRDAQVQLKRHSGSATMKEFLEEVLRAAGPGSDEGAEAAFGLCYLARGEGDYARSDDLIRRVERLVPTDSHRYAWAQFQLAWNRKFAGDPAAAEDLFRRAADAPGVRRSTKVASWYTLATLRSEAGDAAEAKSFLQRVVDEGKRNPADQGVAYYVGLAKKLLEAWEE